TQANTDVFQNEPLTDFSRESSRQAMQHALNEVKTQFGRAYPLVIGNERIPTSTLIDSIDPSHIQQVVGRCGRATVEHARQPIAAPLPAFPAGRDPPPRQRADCLFRVADVLRRRRFELAAWQVYECGKQWREADADVAESIDYCLYYGREMLRLAQ